MCVTENQRKYTELSILVGWVISINLEWILERSKIYSWSKTE